VSSDPRFTPSSFHWTPTTPTLVRSRGRDGDCSAETVEPDVGAVIETVGGTASGEVRVVKVLSPDVVVLLEASVDWTS